MAFGAVSGRFPDEIVERFDIVGFDPRGVGHSEPDFACGEPGEQRALLKSIDGYIDTPEEIAAGEAAANLCIETMGPVGGLLHSAYVANDMDEIRQALGADQISYYGVSYGSRLGLWYATLFPDSVRAMVVDGATNFKIDQTLSQQELVAAEIEGDIAPYAIQLEQALAACADPECPIYNDGDPVGYFRQTAAKMGGTSQSGVKLSLNSQHNWPKLWQGLFELNENDDSSILYEFVAPYLSAGLAGGTTGSINRHINCLDQWALRPQLDRAARLDQPQILDATVAEMLPLWALVRSSSSPRACPFYDQFAPEPFAGPLDGSGVPILVVGNRSDPATPFSESVKFAGETVRNGYLVGADHFKHGVYPGNRCVVNHVHRALIDGVYPSARQVFCEREDEAAKTPTPTAGERIDWTPCGSLECGSILVPADYRDPAAGSINIAVNVHRATAPDQRIGYLLVNPGGPGGSGLEMAFFSTLGAFSDEIIERFDIVGFDPRGVGLSDLLVILSDKVGGFDLNALVGGGSGPEFACGGLGEQLALLNAIEGPVDSPEETAAGEAAANLCVETMGPVGGLLHTEYVANDMDEIRKALGAEQISYYGGSYGSTVGVWYATLFPDSVRAMVVDGADNPVDQAANQQERVAEQLEEIEAMEALLEKALTACADPECPIYNDGDPVGYYLRAAQKLGLVNAAADNHPQAGLFGLVSNLYSEEQWPDLWQGLFELNENDDPALLLESAKFQWLGGEFGEARLADHVNCLDAWVLHPEVDRASQLDDSVVTEALVEEQLPLITAANPFSVGACPFYDQFAPQPLEEPLDGGGVPILVVGNRSDPATPFSESEELATETLSNGYLVETTHYTHVVYPQNECVNEHVDRALIDGELPSERRVFCEEDRTFAPAAEPETAATDEQIEWTPCGKLECGSIQVPADYRDPEAGSIRIAVNVHRATSPDKRIGYLLVNPGGPGSSGVELAFGALSWYFTDEIVERFDIVGFDPRGVGVSDKLVAVFDKAGLDFHAMVGGGSEPEFACGGPGEQLALQASIDGDVDTPEEIAVGEAAANLCIDSMGPVGFRLHSEYVARDMDEIRQALGAEQISYLGFSYGSELGVWYATLFPDSVRAMAVDGARNPFPTDPGEDEADGEDKADKASPKLATIWAVALEAALTACADPECPIYNDGDPVGYFRQAIAKMGLVNAAAKHPKAGHRGVYRAARDETGWPRTCGRACLNSTRTTTRLFCSSTPGKSDTSGNPAQTSIATSIAWTNGSWTRKDRWRATRDGWTAPIEMLTVLRNRMTGITV